MNHDNTTDFTREPWWSVAECVSAYRLAAERGAASLSSLIQHVEPRERPRAWRELIRADMDRSHREGRVKTAQEYLREYPELAEQPQSVDLAGLAREINLRRSATSTYEFSGSDDEEQPSDKTSDYRPSGAPTHLATTSFDHDSSVPERSSTSSHGSGPAPKRIGRYEVRTELGAGTFGSVYRCTDPQLQRDVAIKLPHEPGSSPSRLREFLHEAQGAARIRHPGIVAVLDVGQTDDGRGYIVSELVLGKTMKQRLAEPEYDRKLGMQWVVEVAEALHHAHKQGIVHRDVKPANILIDADDHAHLADFGLARVDDRFFTDDAGKVVGTLAYMSPEQARGESHWATPQTDIYALGVVLYEVLCGRRPFSAESSRDLLDQIQRRNPSPPRTIVDTVDPRIEADCLKAIAKDPAQRFTTAHDFAAALRRSMAPPAKAINKMVPIAALCGVLLMGGAWWIVQTRANSQQERAATQSKDAPPVIPGGGLPLLGDGRLKLEIHLQRAGERGKHAVLQSRDLPVRDGDRVQIVGLFPQPGYFPYIFWYDAQGQGSMLSPASLDRQQQVDVIQHPQPIAGDLQDWLVIGGAPGSEMVFLGVSDRPLSETELAEFTAEKLEFTSPVRVRELVQIQSDGPPVSSGGSGGERPIDQIASAQRAVIGTSKSTKQLLAGSFDEIARRTFTRYSAIVLLHE